MIDKFRDAAVVALLVAAAAMGLWRAFAASAVATAGGTDTAQRHATMFERYRAAAPALRGAVSAGYLSEGDPLATEPYHFARLAVLPTVLVPAADAPVVLADAPNDQTLSAWLSGGGWRVRWTDGHGLAVLEQQR